MYSLDYSRFDHIGDSDDSSQASTVEPPAEEEAPSAEPAGAGVARAIADALNPRLPDAIVLCVHAFLPCARCGASMADGGCRVPHPLHLLVDTGSAFGSGESRKSHSCRACGQDYTMVSRLDAAGNELGAPRCESGTPLCFSGAHTLGPLAADDERRVWRDLADVVADADVQDAIDALDADVRLVKVRSAQWYDDSITPTFARPLARLEVLQLIDVAFRRVALTPETTPALRELEMQNVPEDCEICVRCPELRKVAIRYYPGDEGWVQAMLDHAPKLRTFDSYKLQRARQLQFAGPELELIDLHRTDCLGALSVWAPRLRHLGLQAAYSLEVLEFPETHPVYSRELPASHVPTPFGVNTMNSCLGEAAKNALRANPRARRAAAAHRGMPTEAMFASATDDTWEDDAGDY